MRCHGWHSDAIQKALFSNEVLPSLFLERVERSSNIRIFMSLPTCQAGNPHTSQFLSNSQSWRILELPFDSKLLLFCIYILVTSAVIVSVVGTKHREEKKQNVSAYFDFLSICTKNYLC